MTTPSGSHFIYENLEHLCKKYCQGTYPSLQPLQKHCYTFYLDLKKLLLINETYAN